MDAFDRLQERLGPALAANSAGSTADHVLISLPSYSVSESLLSHYGDRIPSLEHRYLGSILIPGRIPGCRIVYISTRRPDPAVVDDLLDCLPPDRRDRVRAKIRIIDVDDGTPRSVAARLVDRPERLAELRAWIGSAPALIEPWNVTEHEVRLALALGVPINGTRPELRPIGFKSAGRRLFREAGVPVPIGREDVRSVDDVVGAILDIRARVPTAPGVVVKHDDSGAGDGNVVIDLESLDAASDPTTWIRARVAELPDWYLRDLATGGIVEERIAGERISSPSAQVDIRPDGRVVVLATHEQVLGGPGGQVYLGCRFPADPAYAARLATSAAAVGERLAALGALGRFSVDFIAAADADGSWDVRALEVNLRKGGTTHPYSALRNLVPGRYEAADGRWISDDGIERAYSATDNLVDDAWTGTAPTSVLDALRRSGLRFDHRTRTGVVPHMLAGLAIDGRWGLTAIAPTPAEADALEASARSMMDTLVREGAA